MVTEAFTLAGRILDESTIDPCACLSENEINIKERRELQSQSTRLEFSNCNKHRNKLPINNNRFINIVLSTVIVCRKIT